MRFPLGPVKPALATFAFALALGTATVQAGPIGTFNLVGTQDVRVGASWIDWGPFNGSYANCVPGPNGGACSINGSTVGSILFTSGTGGFAGVTGAGAAGTLKDLEDDFAPTATNFSLSNFITSAGAPTLSFTLNFIPVGTGSPAGCTNNPGDVCTPAGSPFTITNNPDGTVSVGLVVLGEVTQAGDPVPSNFKGVFTTQFPNQTALGLLNEIQNNGYASNAQSAGFTATVIPEPGTMALFGGGALLLGLIQWRRRRDA